MSKETFSLLLSDFTSNEPVSSNFLIIFTNRSPTSDHIFFMSYCRELFQTFCQVIASCKRRERSYSQTQYEANRVFIINAMFGTYGTFLFSIFWRVTIVKFWIIIFFLCHAINTFYAFIQVKFPGILASNSCFTASQSFERRWNILYIPPNFNKIRTRNF